MQTFTIDDFPQFAATFRRIAGTRFKAMYSSLYGGIVTDPALMLIPLHDHMVHRGDGIFETFKCVAGRLYNLAAHLDRLERSAAALQMEIPVTRDGLRTIVAATAAAGGDPDASLRILVSRGPGTFGINPYECIGPQLYVTASELGAPFMQKHPDGAAVRTSTVPARQAFLATIKSCNYVPNVLMKKEAVDHGADFVVAYDAAGLLTEGATENMGILTPRDELLFPTMDSVLQGTTMMRAVDLAQALVREGVLARVAFEPVRREQVLAARELLLFGTTSNVIAVTTYDDSPVGNGRPGPVYQRLASLLEHDLRHNDALLTPVPDLLENHENVG